MRHLTFMTRWRRGLGVACLTGLLAAACGPPPKVLVDTAYLGETRTTKVLMQASGDGTFNQIIRVCDLGDDGLEGRCQDTVILENVKPGSLY